MNDDCEQNLIIRKSDGDAKAGLFPGFEAAFYLKPPPG